MNNATKILMAMMMVAGLCIGCGKSETPESVKTDAKSEAATEKWAPETATEEKSEAHDPDDGVLGYWRRLFRVPDLSGGIGHPCLVPMVYCQRDYCHVNFRNIPDRLVNLVGG